MVRLKEIKDRLHPNETFRNWRASHTFGGTTKAKSLYIAGFRRKNFYYVAAITGAVLLIGSIAGGVSFRKSIGKAEDRGQNEGAIGQLIVAGTTESRIRTLTSDGIVVVTTEISSFSTTVQRGAGTTLVQTTGVDGKTTAIPGSITFVRNSDDMMVEKTLLGSTFFMTQTDGITVPTTLYGAPTTFTDTNGKDITSTIFSELTVVTEAGGDTSTFLRSQPSSITVSITNNQTTPPTPINGSTATKTNGDVSSGTSTMDQTRMSSSSTSTSSTSSSIRPTSSLSLSSSSTPSTPSTTITSASKPTSSTSSASGGGDALFQGEGTFYTPGLGSCGTDNTEAQFVAALSKVLFDATGVANSNNNPYCGRRALVKAASAKRLLKRENISRGDIAEQVPQSRNFTLAGWKKSRGMKKDRRSRITSKIRLEQRGLQNNPQHRRPPTEYIFVPMPTPVIERYNLDLIPLWPVITPPPKAHNTNLKKRQVGGGGVTITIVDRCPVCAQYDLDLSPAAFDAIGDQGDGRIAIEWSWLD